MLSRGWTRGPLRPRWPRRRLSGLAATSLALLLAIPLLGCHYATRSAYRKLAAYEPERLLTLDPRQMRVAFLLDERTPLDREGTLVRLEAGFEGEIKELVRFHPLIAFEGASTAGLPPAKGGFSWTVLGPRTDDHRLVARIWRLFWRMMAKISSLPPGTEPTPEEKTAFRAELAAIFPEMQSTVGRQGPFELTYYYYWKISPSEDVPRQRFPIEIWLLLDPKDGWFRLVEGPLNLDEI